MVKRFARALIAIVGLGLVAGCAGDQVWAPQEAVTRAAYHDDGPPELTLFTMLNNKTGAGAHTSLMINADQRVIFDPAGSFKHHAVPERNDVLYGITPKIEDLYTRFHARKTYHVKIQTLKVSAQTAARAERLVQDYGAVPHAQCSLSTSRILAELFPNYVKPSWFPRTTSEEFAKIPGVSEKELYEYDSDDKSKLLAAWNPPADNAPTKTGTGTQAETRLANNASGDIAKCKPTAEGTLPDGAGTC